MDEVGGVLRSLFVVGAEHGILDVLFQHLALHSGIARRTAVAVEEIGEIEVGLELADIAVELINAATVGRGGGAFVATGPFAKHTGGVAVVAEDFGQDDVGGVVRFLAHDGIVGVVAIADAAAPIFLVGPDVGVTGVLACHEGGTRRCRHGAAGIRLGEAHPFGGEAVDVGRGDKLLAVASEVAITHVVAHDVKDIGPRLRPGG